MVKNLKDIEIIAITSCSSICMVVPKGESKVFVGSKLSKNIRIGAHIGIIPMSTNKTVVTTDGLYWNLSTLLNTSDL